MKKTLFLGALAAVLACEAKSAEIQPYVGADYAYSMIKISDSSFTNKKFHALNVLVGGMLTSTLGLELSYQQSKEKKKTTVLGKTRTEYKAYALDGVYYYSVFDNIQLLGSAGLGYYEARAKFKTGLGKLSGEDEHYGLRAGLGAQYNINSNWAARLMFRYHYIRADYLKNMKDITIGARYYF